MKKATLNERCTMEIVNLRNVCILHSGCVSYLACQGVPKKVEYGAPLASLATYSAASRA